MSVAALVLAGGEAQRFGRPKQLADWKGKTLLSHVVDLVETWPGVESVYIVLGARAEEIMDQADLSGHTVIENLEWQEGLASSLRAGLDFLIGERSVKQALLVLGDQPHLTGEVVPKLVEAQKRSRRPVVIPRYRFTRGHPVLVHRSIWHELVTGLNGDQGARNLFLSHPDWVEEVRVDAPPPGDIDTPEDLERLSRLK
ncbi:MAG: nucleotidyltransferase family protein [Acidimicrobiia bacterium]|nr:nucleotidyltransferase family protein [bacterium]MXZ06109.1 nucleotidyltransferase family protein [Acidimicrobiia bacterium]MCY3579804.1 nucleotidyltransferase family protein [bacterium]MCY3652870.1 nucleotidyltransferase family protein [bacterium]MDE0643674.1 nucleotidyltransferase family protein [bacterium]